MWQSVEKRVRRMGSVRECEKRVRRTYRLIQGFKPIRDRRGLKPLCGQGGFNPPWNNNKPKAFPRISTERFKLFQFLNNRV